MKSGCPGRVQGRRPGHRLGVQAGAVGHKDWGEGGEGV